MAQPEGSESHSTSFDELLQPLAAQLATIEANRNPHHREVLSFTAFVRLLIYYFAKAPGSGRQLLTDTLSAAPELGLTKVRRSTFFDAFQRFPVAWFFTLLTTLLTTIAWKAIPELDTLGKLYCVDGSLFPALVTMLWAEYKTNHRAIRLHLCFELNRMLAVQFIVAEGNSNEKQVLREMLEAGVTYIADRGYVCFQLLADIVTAEAHFVIRMKTNLAYTVVETLAVDLPEVVRHLFVAVTDQRVCLNNAKGQPTYRLVTFQVGKALYLVLTDRLDLTTFQVILLYAYRWQVELIFRFLKRTMNGLHLVSTSQQGVTIQFYALLIAALLQLRLKQRCVETYESLHCYPADPVGEADPLPGLMVEPEKLASARGSTFLATIGQKLHRYWKISIHWLVTLRNLLAQPFDERALRLLACT
jgi:hypothetical protein